MKLKQPIEKPTMKIVVKVWRGLVSEVYASNPDVEVSIIDEDDENQAPIVLPEHRVY